MNASLLIEILKKEIELHGDQRVIIKLAEISNSFNIKSIAAGKDAKGSEKMIFLVGAFNAEGFAQYEAGLQENLN